MSSFLLGTDGVVHITDADGTTSLLAGTPIVSTSVAQAALAAGLVIDGDTFPAPAIAAAGVASLLPILLAEPETIYAGAVIATAAVLPALISDADGFSAPSIVAEIPGHGTQHIRPSLISDVDAIYSSAIGASLKPQPVASDDTIAATDITAAKGTAFVPSDDVVFPFRTTLFVAPPFVADADFVPVADVGWHLFVDAPVTDVDHVFGPFAQGWSYIRLDIYGDEDSTLTYPFRIQSVTGGIPVPRPIGVLTGTLGQPRRLSGSIATKRTLTGSLANKTRRVLTGSLHNRKNR